MQPTYIFICDWTPTSIKKDITQRYRIAYNMVSQLNIDCIFFMENDDWYSDNYLESMLSEWEKAGKPNLFGIDYTIYYHVGLRAWRKFEHLKRASMMNTLIKPSLNIDWCKDDEPYTDLHIWLKQPSLSKALISPEFPLSIGIKHGTGLSGGNYHTNNLKHYHQADEDLKFLSGIVDKDSLKFYETMFDSSIPVEVEPPSQIDLFGKRRRF